MFPQTEAEQLQHKKPSSKAVAADIRRDRVVSTLYKTHRKNGQDSRRQVLRSCVCLQVGKVNK